MDYSEYMGIWYKIPSEEFFIKLSFSTLEHAFLNNCEIVYYEDKIVGKGSINNFNTYCESGITVSKLESQWLDSLLETEKYIDLNEWVDITCKEKYPVGTVFEVAHLQDRGYTIGVLPGDSFKIIGDDIYLVDPLDTLQCYYGVRQGCDHAMNRTVYSNDNNNWAKIISKPEPEVKSKEPSKEQSSDSFKYVNPDNLLKGKYYKCSPDGIDGRIAIFKATSNGTEGLNGCSIIDYQEFRYDSNITNSDYYNHIEYASPLESLWLDYCIKQKKYLPYKYFLKMHDYPIVPSEAYVAPPLPPFIAGVDGIGGEIEEKENVKSNDDANLSFLHEEKENTLDFTELKVEEININI